MLVVRRVLRGLRTADGLRSGRALDPGGAVTAAHARRLQVPLSVTDARFAIVVVGAGNIGSHVVPLLARLVGLGRLIIVDRDVYEAKNLRGQAIRPADVDKAKASVQAARARRLAPTLDVRAVVGDVATLPFGVFRAHLVLGCLDSRAARQCLGEIAFRMGLPYLDGGIDVRGLIARVSVFDARVADAPCLACAWGEADYAALEQVQPCQDAPSAAAPATDAPAALGALTASLLAIECEKWIRGGKDRLGAGAEVMLDASSHTHHRTRERRNPACRFDHERWTIERLGAGPSALSVDTLLAHAAATPDAAATATPDDATLAVAGQRFVTQVACGACGTTRPLVRLAAALRPRDRICLACGRPTAPRGWDLVDRVAAISLGPAARRRPLHALGFRHGNVVAIDRGGAVHHFELA